MIEQDIVDYVQGELARRGIFYLNVLGSYMTTRTGQPDIVASIDGQFVAIECKMTTETSTVQFRRGLELIASGGRFIVANKDIDIDKMIAGSLATFAVNPLSDAEAIPKPKSTIEYVASEEIPPLKVSAGDLTYGELVAKEKYEIERTKAREQSVAKALEDRTEMQARPIFYPETTSERVYIDWDDEFTSSATRSAHELIKNDRFALLTAKTGIGKTAVAVATAGKLAEDVKKDIKVAIIAPTKAIDRESWIKHINEWNATHKYQLIVVWHTSPRGFTLAMKDKKNIDFIKKEIGKTGLFIIDEVQDFKNPTSKGSRALAKLKVLNKFALTATDITNDKLKDIASYLIIAGYYPSFNDFMNKENLKDLRNKNNKFLVYMENGEIDTNKWKEWLKIEQKWRHIHVKYDEPTNISLPKVENRTVTIEKNTILEQDIKSVFTAQRLRSFDTPRQAYQAVSDRVYTDSERLTQIIDIVKDKNTIQPLLFYTHNSVKNALKKLFLEQGILWQEVSGEVKSSDFDEQKTAPVFIQYKSGGSSIEFPLSNTTIFAENQPSVARHIQAKGRNVRRGMTGIVYQYILHADTFFDTRMLENRHNLQEIADRDFEKNFMDSLIEEYQ
jgi:superfamily II DNA or RNA helicase